MKARSILPSFACVLLASFVGSGCFTAHQHYAIYDHPRLDGTALKPLTPPPSVELIFEFVPMTGTPHPLRSRQWRQHAVMTLSRTRLFSKVNVEGTPSDYQFTIRMENVAESLAGPRIKGYITGLTWGAVGSRVADHYAISATAEAGPGKRFTQRYEYAIISTRGLKSGPQAEPHENVNSALEEVVDQFLLEWLMDLQNRGFFSAPAVGGQSQSSLKPPLHHYEQSI